MIYLRQSTASQEIPIGPLVDSSDGNTEETGLTIANTDIKLWKCGASSLVSKNSGGATHTANGTYIATLDATDTNTAGSLRVQCHISGALVWWVDCVVLPSNVYDSMVAGTDYLNADVQQIHGEALSATTGVNIEHFFYNGDEELGASVGLASYIDGSIAAVNIGSIDADIVTDSRTWIAVGPKCSNIVEVKQGFIGTLALKPDANPATTLSTVSAVSITGAATVTASGLAVDRSRTQAHFTVPALNTTGTYTVVVTVTTVDGQTIKTQGTMVVV